MDVAEKSLVIEITGDTEKVDALIELLRSFGIRELVRTGRIAMVRGRKSTASGLCYDPQTWTNGE